MQRKLETERMTGLNIGRASAQVNTKMLRPFDVESSGIYR